MLILFIIIFLMLLCFFVVVYFVVVILYLYCCVFFFSSKTITIVELQVLNCETQYSNILTAIITQQERNGIDSYNILRRMRL